MAKSLAAFVRRTARRSHARKQVDLRTNSSKKTEEETFSFTVTDRSSDWIDSGKLEVDTYDVSVVVQLTTDVTQNEVAMSADGSTTDINALLNDTGYHITSQSEGTVTGFSCGIDNTHNGVSTPNPISRVYRMLLRSILHLYSDEEIYILKDKEPTHVNVDITIPNNMISIYAPGNIDIEHRVRKISVNNLSQIEKISTSHNQHLK
ncbi:hypothetical protein O3G_MSEX001858 [Manduca sexta]|uniref:Uncharacterized protein n=1 Tax=Manduca sexta TaxID=7130 RepID=A0A921YLB8_MANSE|nr:hypothetical protein O3G_MSEX001858 [Manduca sexta]